MRDRKPNRARAFKRDRDGYAFIYGRNVNDSKRSGVRCWLCGETLSPDSKCGCGTRECIHPVNGCDAETVYYSPLKLYLD